MQPADSLPPSAAAPVPLAGGPPRGGRLCYAHVGRRHVHPLTRRAPETPHRLSATPEFSSRRGEGLPGSWTILFVRALVEHPAGDKVPPRPGTLDAGVVVAFDESQLSRHPGSIGFGAAVPHGPHVCMPTHRPSPFWNRRKA